MCACGETGTCGEPGLRCNCDRNDDVWRSDEGYITNKHDLPVKGFCAGDTGNHIISFPLRLSLTKSIHCIKYHCINLIMHCVLSPSVYGTEVQVLAFPCHCRIRLMFYVIYILLALYNFGNKLWLDLIWFLFTVIYTGCPNRKYESFRCNLQY